MKYLICLFFAGCITFPKGSLTTVNQPISAAQEAAHNILVAKCNICHQTENPSKVFTLENMNGFSKRIKRQVFLWKRMPKGDDIKLSSEEKQILKYWIKSLK